MNITKIILLCSVLSAAGCSAPVHEPKKIAGIKAPLYSVEVDWQAVNQTIDDQPANDIAGYLIHWGEKSTNYTQVEYVEGAQITSHVVDNLLAGGYYFAVSAVTDSGVESDLSDEIYQEVGI